MTPKPLTPTQWEVLEAARDGHLRFDRARTYLDNTRPHRTVNAKSLQALRGLITIPGSDLPGKGVWVITAEGRARLKRRRKD